MVAGLGNIYVCEALFRAGISPKRLAGAVKTRADRSRWCAAIKKVLKDAIAAGGSTLRDHAQATGDPGNFQHHFLVYGREGKPCLSGRKKLHGNRQAHRAGRPFDLLLPRLPEISPAPRFN